MTKTPLAEENLAAKKRLSIKRRLTMALKAKGCKDIQVSGDRYSVTIEDMAKLLEPDTQVLQIQGSYQITLPSNYHGNRDYKVILPARCSSINPEMCTFELYASTLSGWIPLMSVSRQIEVFKAVVEKFKLHDLVA